MSQWENNEEIQYFREYLRIPSVQPDVNYGNYYFVYLFLFIINVDLIAWCHFSFHSSISDGCLRFLQAQAQNLELPIRVFHPSDPKKPVIVITWTGIIPELPSIVLNSHMDVVPVFEEHWTHSPFAADIDEKGKIFARGTQDMKSVGMQYLGAVRAMKKAGVQLKRTVHVTFVPDEEISGVDGMQSFVPSDDFKALNVGFALDEGYASPVDEFPIFYAEKSVWSNSKFYLQTELET